MLISDYFINKKNFLSKKQENSLNTYEQHIKDYFRLELHFSNKKKLQSED